MSVYQFVVKNYRCFSDENPARFVISRGMISFIGVNNSGKSALLKFFLELRNVWNAGASYAGTGGTNAFLSQFLHVFDQTEVFYDQNERPLSIEITLLDAPQMTGENLRIINKVGLICDRNLQGNNPAWALSYFSDDEQFPYTPPNQAVSTDGRGGLIYPGRAMRYSPELVKDMFRIFAQSLYIGPFRNAITVGSGTHFELTVGETFINTWNEWQNGASKASNRAINVVTENIRNVMGFSQLSITASLSAKTLQLNINNRPYKINEVGSGLAQLIVVFGNAMIKKPTIVFIDEPELNLHPRLQLEFLTNLASYASYGVVFATHSIGLARSAAERIYTVSRDKDGSLISIYEKTVNLVEMLGELSFSAYRELGAAKLLLVEGTTDVKVMQQLLRKAGKEHEVVVLPLGGNSLARGGVEHELAELKRVAESIWAIVDSERDAAGAAADPARVAFETLCRKLGYQVLVTERRATENYFDDRAIKAALGPSFSALEHFDRLKGHANPWSKADNWRIAQELEWSAIKDTDLGRFIHGI